MVGECTGARAAISAILERPPAEGIDLVLLDMTMPDGTGLDVLRHVRARAADVDVIAVTGVRDADVVRQVVALGVAQYLVKPFTFAIFRERLEQYRDYRRASTRCRRPHDAVRDRRAAQRPAAERARRAPEGALGRHPRTGHRRRSDGRRAVGRGDGDATRHVARRRAPVPRASRRCRPRRALASLRQSRSARDRVPVAGMTERGDAGGDGRVRPRLPRYRDRDAAAPRPARAHRADLPALLGDPRHGPAPRRRDRGQHRREHSARSAANGRLGPRPARAGLRAGRPGGVCRQRPRPRPPGASARSRMGNVAQARAATEATFVYTNAAPQASVFNQSKELWVGLEDHVLQFADATEQRRIGVHRAGARRRPIRRTAAS